MLILYANDKAFLNHGVNLIQPLSHKLGIWPSKAKVYTLVACFLLIILGCSKVDEDSQKRETKPRPIMKFEEETVLENFQDSILQWRLRTQYLERWSGSERIFVKPIDVDIFDSTGVKVAFLRADSGSLDTKMTFINAYGHVHAHSPDGASVRADSLTWSKSSNRVQTQSPVRVVSPEGDVLAGVGFISDSKLDNWQILKNVRGIFQDATKRLKEGPPKQKKSSLTKKRGKRKKEPMKAYQNPKLKGNSAKVVKKASSFFKRNTGGNKK